MKSFTDHTVWNHKDLSIKLTKERLPLGYRLLLLFGEDGAAVRSLRDGLRPELHYGSAMDLLCQLYKATHIRAYFFPNIMEVINAHGISLSYE